MFTFKRIETICVLKASIFLARGIILYNSFVELSQWSWIIHIIVLFGFSIRFILCRRPMKSFSESVTRYRFSSICFVWSCWKFWIFCDFQMLQRTVGDGPPPGLFFYRGYKHGRVEVARSNKDLLLVEQDWARALYPPVAPIPVRLWNDSY